MESASATSPPPHVTAIVLTVCAGLLTAGVKMYESPLLGALLITIATAGIWWVLAMNLFQMFPRMSPSKSKILWSGYGVVLVFGLILAWNSNSSSDPPESKPSINQGGTITGGSGSITNNNNSNNTTNNLIVVVPTPNPQVAVGQFTLLNEKTQDGYQTHIPIKVIAPYPVGNLSVVVQVKTLVRANLSVSKGTLIQSGEGDKVEKERVSIGAQNVRGDLTLVIDTTERIDESNPVKIDARAE